MFRQAANSPSMVQILIHVADLQKHYGHKSGDIEIQQVESYQCKYNKGPNKNQSCYIKSCLKFLVLLFLPEVYINT